MTARFAPRRPTLGIGLRDGLSRAQRVVDDEGVAAAARKVRRYLLAQRSQQARSNEDLPLRYPPDTVCPQSVLVVADRDLPQGFHYRVEQRWEAARSLDVPFFFADRREPQRAASLLALASVLLLYRTAWDRDVALLVGLARRYRVPVVFETDDAVHRRDWLEVDENVQSLSPVARRRVLSGADRFRKTLRESDHAIGSTQVLADDLSSTCRGRAFVIENGIDSVMSTIARGVARERELGLLRPFRPGWISLCYGTGSKAHDSDLRLIAPALADVLARHPRVCLRLIGPVAMPETLARFGDRISLERALPYPVYLRELARCDIALAPLRPGAFNEAKSHVKYLEAGLMGVPMVASPAVYRRYILDGRTGLIAATAQLWSDCLDSLVTDATLRLGLASAAATHVQNWDTERLAVSQYLPFLDAIGGVVA